MVKRNKIMVKRTAADIKEQAISSIGDYYSALLKGVDYNNWQFPGLDGSCVVKLVDGTVLTEGLDTHCVNPSAYLPQGVIIDFWKVVGELDADGNGNMEVYQRTFYPYSQIASISEDIPIKSIPPF